ncbi:MAG: hypothetical protein A2W80_11270 [Candidatus Riflebacteria bacterium GWC2_50_8]|nr:MAG: hypothetical protein A2W80_11270 [Candidatus Riflebacteria bacterium GWC2_50_8]
MCIFLQFNTCRRQIPKNLNCLRKDKCGGHEARAHAFVVIFLAPVNLKCAAKRRLKNMCHCCSGKNSAAGAENGAAFQQNSAQGFKIGNLSNMK